MVIVGSSCHDTDGGSCQCQSDSVLMVAAVGARPASTDTDISRTSLCLYWCCMTRTRTAWIQSGQHSTLSLKVTRSKAAISLSHHVFYIENIKTLSFITDLTDSSIEIRLNFH